MGVLAFGFRVSVLSTWYLTSRECTCGVATGGIAGSCRNSLETRTFHWPMLPRSVGSLVRYIVNFRHCRSLGRPVVTLLVKLDQNLMVYLEPTRLRRCGVLRAQGQHDRAAA